jgi:hypothetical protein
MKTFKDLKCGDKLIVKNYPEWINCDVIIDGHHYTREKVYVDKEFTIVWKPIICSDGSGIGFGGTTVIELHIRESDCQSMWPTRIQIPYYEYGDKSETDKYKIVE